ncbi:hypothetical protein LJB42_003348 [Komagataella kurtzmanii]|nr:hypothetical protein LJB42_003348 [Komagataella kurtzmanii]
MSEIPEIPESISKLVGPLLKRASEVKLVDPAVAYFCLLHAAESILNKGLHQTSDEVAKFAMTLLDLVEKTKSEASEDLLELFNNQEAGFLHTEQFAVAVFNKAFLDVRNKTTTKATIDKFRASLVFFDLLNLWDFPLSDETLMKVKYAKYHAARILRAYKAGQDPNDYVLDSQSNDDIQEESIDITNQNNQTKEDTKTVLSISSPEHSPDLQGKSPSPDLPSPPKFIKDNQNIVGDSALPSAPTFIKGDDAMFPKTPSFIDDSNNSEKTENIPEEAPAPSAPIIPKSPTAVKPVSSPAPPKTKKQSHLGAQDIKEILDTEESITKAQKHAKYAISALNYEDISTATKELELALKLLKSLSQ